MRNRYSDEKTKRSFFDINPSIHDDPKYNRLPVTVSKRPFVTVRLETGILFIRDIDFTSDNPVWIKRFRANAKHVSRRPTFFTRHTYRWFRFYIRSRQPIIPFNRNRLLLSVYLAANHFILPPPPRPRRHSGVLDGKEGREEMRGSVTSSTVKFSRLSTAQGLDVWKTKREAPGMWVSRRQRGF